jgi:N-acetylmuramoyl-L-alanine amidase
MIIKECYATNHNSFKNEKLMTGNRPVGSLLHSTGANNPNLKRYVQPSANNPRYNEIIDDIGKNMYNNAFNNFPNGVSVHYVIGKNAKGTVCTYQLLPDNYCCYGCGAIPYDKNGKELPSGSHKDFDHYGQSYNYNPQAHIQCEICEDDLTDKEYFEAVWKEATELFAHICKTYKLPVSTIVSHKEAHAKGYASNHGDPEHWFKKFGKTMKDFRNDVNKLLNPVKATKTIYRVQVGAFSKKENAETYLKKLKQAGFNGYIVEGKV